MEKKSAYPTPNSGVPADSQQPQQAQQPQQQVPYNVPTPKPPTAWQSFKGGLDSVNKYKNPGLNAQEWADTKLTRQQWLAKYPGSSAQDYFNWRQSVQRRKKQPTNWFQRVIYPLNRFIPRSQ